MSLLTSRSVSIKQRVEFIGDVKDFLKDKGNRR